MSEAINRGTCPTGKHQFWEEDDAEREATIMTRNNLHRLRPDGRTACRSYLCPDCGAWHVTSQPLRPTRG